MSFVESGRWQALYLSAMSESNEADRRTKVEAAHTEMRKRMSALKRRRDTDSILEVQAITTALDKLAPLRGPETATQLPKAASPKEAVRAPQTSD